MHPSPYSACRSKQCLLEITVALAACGLQSTNNKFRKFTLNPCLALYQTNEERVESVDVAALLCGLDGMEGSPFQRDCRE